MKLQQFWKKKFLIKNKKMITFTIVAVILLCLTSLSSLLLNKSSERTNLHSFYTPIIINQSVNMLNYHQIEEPSFLSQFSLYAPPIPSLSISGTFGQNGWYTSNVKISLYTTENSSGLLQIEYAFYNQEWTTFTEPFTILAEGQTALYYRSRYVGGAIGVTESHAIDIDKTPPYGSILIDGGFEDAFSTLVNLTLSVTDEPSGPTTHPPSGYIWGVPSGPADMRFSNNGVFWSPWESFTNNKTWNMEAGAGTKTVYAQARDNAGLVSETFTDTINLITDQDSLAPETKISLSGKKGAKDVYTSDVVIIFDSTDNLSGVNMTEYSFDANSWTQYASPFYISTEGETTVYYRTYDFAGNMELMKTETFTIERNRTSDSELSPLVTYSLFVIATIIILATIFIIRKKRTINHNNTPEIRNARAEYI